MRAEGADLCGWLKAAWEGMRTGRPDLRPDYATPQIQETNRRLRGGQKQVQRGMGNVEMLLLAFDFFLNYYSFFFWQCRESNSEPSTWLAKYY